MQQEPIIEIKNLGTFLNNNWIHKNLDLTIYPNRIITLIGASGSGKTTLIREILALQPYEEGEIYLLGKKQDQQKSNNTIGMMFQQGALFSSLTVLENIMFPLQEYTKFSKSAIMRIAKLKLSLTGLNKNAYYLYPSEISGGMRKRVALARAIAMEPKILFLDEPTAGLDPNSANDFDELISSLQKQLALTVIMITHDLDSIWRISDEIIYLGNKKVIFHDSVKNAANNKDISELYNYFNGSRGKITKDFYIKNK